jgi:D-tyrosyl-tRNA(Tyr) deacylase
MIAVIQRVQEACVDVGGQRHSSIGPGSLVLLGVEKGDTLADAACLARKLVELRMFRDEQDRMNRSLQDFSGEMLVVSQFTLAGDCRKGRRPSFDLAAPPEEADALYQAFVAEVRGRGTPVQTGEFGAAMQVRLVNDGPVTFVLRSRNGQMA